MANIIMRVIVHFVQPAEYSWQIRLAADHILRQYTKHSFSDEALCAAVKWQIPAHYFLLY